jgi:lipopolysaccharide export system permease protein
MVLGNYLRGRVAGQMLALLAVLTGLMQLLELLDVTTDVLDRNLGIGGVIHYALLRLPSEMMVALPLAALLGAMSSFYAMARSREITALRSAGVSLTSILLRLLPVPLVFAALQFGLSQMVVPVTEAKLKIWWDSTAPADEGSSYARWVHTNGGPVSFERSSADGRKLQGLRIYTRGSDGMLTTRTMAARADWTGEDWTLAGFEELRIDDGVASRLTDPAGRSWRSNLRPEDVMQLDVAQPHLSSVMLADVIAGERVGGQPLSYYQTVLMRSYAAPLVVFIMLLLAVPPAVTLERGGVGGGRLLLALALGLGFLLCDGIMSAMGTSARVPPITAALTAPVIFTLIGLLQLMASERR